MWERRQTFRSRLLISRRTPAIVRPEPSAGAVSASINRRALVLSSSSGAAAAAAASGGTSLTSVSGRRAFGAGTTNTPSSRFLFPLEAAATAAAAHGCHGPWRVACSTRLRECQSEVSRPPYCPNTTNSPFSHTPPKHQPSLSLALLQLHGTVWYGGAHGTHSLQHCPLCSGQGHSSRLRVGRIGSRRIPW